MPCLSKTLRSYFEPCAAREASVSQLGVSFHAVSQKNRGVISNPPVWDISRPQIY